MPAFEAAEKRVDSWVWLGTVRGPVAWESGSDREVRAMSTHRAVPARSVHAGPREHSGGRKAGFRFQLGPPSVAPRVEFPGACRTGALGHRDAAREVRQEAKDRFAGERVRSGAPIHVGVRVEAALVLEHRAVLDDARVGRARRQGTREYVAVPAVHEVAVQTVTGGVAVREDEAPAVVQIVEWGRVVVHLIEEGHEVNWVCGRAKTSSDTVRERHVRLVV